MNKYFAALIVLYLSIAVLTGCSEDVNTKSAMTVQSVLGNADAASNFKKLYEPQPISFPKDHGAHPDYQTEWWYLTGNLFDENQRRFGYQLTFFRFGLGFDVDKQDAKRESQWASDQTWMAHFALTDVSNKKFYYKEKFSRGALALAGAAAEPLNVWLDDWSIEERQRNKTTCAGCLNLKVNAETENFSLSLLLNSVKPAALNGDKGLSQKSNQPGNASMYYSLSRMGAQGNVTIDGKTYAVQGSSWMDREWSTSVLASDQTGWDWFSLQLENGDDLMLYQIRKKNGTVDDASSGSLINVTGDVSALAKNEFEITVLDRWASPHSKTTYPAKWKIKLPDKKIELEITPYINDQEFNLAFRYWEGAVEVVGEIDGKKVVGKGYVELTGY